MSLSACQVLTIYAIGGITAARMPEILQAGAAGGCMMSGFIDSLSLMDSEKFSQMAKIKKYNK